MTFARKRYVPAPRPPVTPATRRGRYTPASNEAVAVPKDAPVRSEAYRRYVAAQECFGCRLEGFSQCAHVNQDKGMAMKTSDADAFPLCGPRHGLIGCHSAYDLALDGMAREERREWAQAKAADMRRRAEWAGWVFEAERIVAP